MAKLMTLCPQCGAPMWAGPPNEPQRPCWPCQQKAAASEGEAPLTEAERAFLAAGHAYCAARRDAFNRAQEGTQKDADRRRAIVDECSRVILVAMMALEPRSPRDNGA